MTQRSKKIVAGVIAGVALVGALGGWLVYDKLLREQPLVYQDEMENFEYGSIGTEKGGLAIPYWIWLVMPKAFPQYLPGPGYASLGFLFEDGHDTPIGTTKKVVGQPMVGINCCMCHVASVRESAGQKPKFYVGAPAHQFDTQAYFRFLFNSASDDRFNADVLMPEIEAASNMSFIDRLIYRYIMIPQTKKGLMGFKTQMAFMEKQPTWLRGRIDPFNPAKYRYLGQPNDDSIGNADNMSIWGMKGRIAGKSVYHWDGLLEGPLQEVVLSSALGDSVLPKNLSLEVMGRIQKFVEAMQPPPYPFSVDKALASEGEKVWKQACASCHAAGGERTGKVVPQAEVGTDDHRMKMWTRAAADSYNAFGKDYPWKFDHFQKLDGYSAVMLDGIWLRGPYLHNGSVPSLAELLEPVAQRPAVFYRGYDVYDPVKVGFVSQGPEAQAAGSKYDISIPGNSNAGHLYGTDLSPENKKALVEYLKTL